MVNSRDKGKRGERLFAEALRLLGFSARRGVQFSGGAGSPDVVTSLTGLHFEVKNVESLNIWAALEQASKDAHDKVPVVAFKRNKSGWYLVIALEDLFSFAEEICDKRRDESQAS